MISFALVQPWQRILRCSAKRSPRGLVACEKEALHQYGAVSYGNQEHGGRDVMGRWHFWGVE